MKHITFKGTESQLENLRLLLEHGSNDLPQQVTDQRQVFDHLARELEIIDQYWSVDDIRSTADEMEIELTFLELESVASLLSRRHDAEIGTSWETIRIWIDHVVGERK